MLSPSKTSPDETDPTAETALAWAERRHAMADRLAILGMRLAEEVVERAVNSPYHPEAKHEPGRAFAQVSRAVRFTLTLQARIQQQIIALRNGKLTSNQVDPVTKSSDRPPLSLRLRARDAVAEAIERESPEREVSRGAFERLNENLIDRETYDTFLHLPFRDCVEAICADLGLDPQTVWSSDGADLAAEAVAPGRVKRPDPPIGSETTGTAPRNFAAGPEATGDRSGRIVQLEPG